MLLCCSGVMLCPWFKVIHDALLHKWWQAMDEGKLDLCYDPVSIFRAPGVEKPQ